MAIGEDVGDAPLFAEIWLERGLALAQLGPDEAEAAAESLHEAVAYAQQDAYHRVLREASDARQRLGALLDEELEPRLLGLQEPLSRVEKIIGIVIAVLCVLALGGAYLCFSNLEPNGEMVFMTPPDQPRCCRASASRCSTRAPLRGSPTPRSSRGPACT